MWLEDEGDRKQCLLVLMGATAERRKVPLAARSIERIGICLLRDGAPLVWPGRRVVRVDLLAARAGASPPATGVRP